MKLFRYVCLLLGLSVLLGILFYNEQSPKQEPVPPPVSPAAVVAPVVEVSLLQEPLSASLVEFPSQALPLWHKYKSSKPTLLLFSQDPFLWRLPAAGGESFAEQLSSVATDALKDRLNPLSADPLLLPRMSLRAAIEADLLASVVWVFPSKVSAEQFDLELFRKQLVESGAATKEEAQTFELKAGGFDGKVGNVILRAMPIDRLLPLEEAVLLHIDLSYFAPLYKGEIKTPLYPLLYDQLKLLRDLQLKALAVSISLSNMDGGLPLSTRFIGATLQRLLAEPQLLDQSLPQGWEAHARGLYLDNFFQSEKIDELYRQLLESEPQNAAAHYAHYLNLRKLKKGTEALERLAVAVQIDSAYAVEYLGLAATAMDKKRPDQALAMLDQAVEAMPDNPFVQLQKAEMLLRFGHGELATESLAALEQQPWSKIYYPQMPSYIETLKSATLKPETESSPTE